MLLGVREDQRRSPRAAVQEPPVDAKDVAEQLHIREQVFGGVHAHIGGGITRVRRAPPTAALVEKHDPVPLRIEVATTTAPAPGTRSPVDDQCGLAVGIAARLPVDPIAIAYIEQALVVRLDRGVRLGRACSYLPLRSINSIL